MTGRVVDEAGEAVAHGSVSLDRRGLWDQAIGRRERQLHGQSRGVQDLRRGARRLCNRREIRRDGARWNGVRYSADLLPWDPCRERGADGHRRPWAGGARDSNRARPCGHGHSSGRCPCLRPRPVGSARIRHRSRDWRSKAYGRTATGIAAGNGSVRIAGLLPGAYVVEAGSLPGPEFASVPVVVEGSDVAGVTLVLSEGATARGRNPFRHRQSSSGAPPV